MQHVGAIKPSNHQFGISENLYPISTFIYLVFLYYQIANRTSTAKEIASEFWIVLR